MKNIQTGNEASISNFENLTIYSEYLKLSRWLIVVMSAKETNIFVQGDGFSHQTLDAFACLDDALEYLEDHQPCPLKNVGWHCPQAFGV